MSNAQLPPAYQHLSEIRGIIQHENKFRLFRRPVLRDAETACNSCPTFKQSGILAGSTLENVEDLVADLRVGCRRCNVASSISIYHHVGKCRNSRQNDLARFGVFELFNIFFLCVMTVFRYTLCVFALAQQYLLKNGQRLIGKCRDLETRNSRINSLIVLNVALCKVVDEGKNAPRPPKNRLSEIISCVKMKPRLILSSCTVEEETEQCSESLTCTGELETSFRKHCSSDASTSAEMDVMSDEYKMS